MMNFDDNTQIVGFIANPMEDMRISQMVNKLAMRQGLNAVCIPFQVYDDDLDKMLRSTQEMTSIVGIIVMNPYKERILDFCGELTVLAELVGSVNALRLDHERGVLVGGNFDGEGFVAGLRHRSHEIHGKRVLLIGTGRAGKSIAYAVAQEMPAELTISSRSIEQANRLVKKLHSLLPKVYIRAGDKNPAGYDVVINATPLGLRDDDALPLPTEQMTPGTLVCEAVIRAGNTPLLSAAERQHCSIHHGQYLLYGKVVQICQFLGMDLHKGNVARILLAVNYRKF